VLTNAKSHAEAEHFFLQLEFLDALHGLAVWLGYRCVLDCCGLGIEFHVN